LIDTIDIIAKCLARYAFQNWHGRNADHDLLKAQAANYAIQLNDSVISSPPAMFEENIWRTFTTLSEDLMIDDKDISDTGYSALT
jgi:hypothetical protein